MAVRDDLDERRARANIVQSYGSLLTPLLVIAATFVLNATLERNKQAAQIEGDKHAREERAAVALRDNQQQCLTTNLQLIAAAHGSVTEGDRSKRDSEVATLAPFVRKFCDAADIHLSQPAQAVLQQTSAGATEITVASAAQSAIAPVSVPKVSGQVPASPAALAPQAPQTATSGIRLYLQIADEGQRQAARDLVAALKGKTLAGRSLVTPGIERVGTYPNSPELRCLKPADCRLAPALAAYLSQRLSGQQVTVRDLSQTYGSNPGVAAGTYELWFGPPGQKLTVSDPGA